MKALVILILGLAALELAEEYFEHQKAMSECVQRVAE